MQKNNRKNDKNNKNRRCFEPIPCPFLHCINFCCLCCDHVHLSWSDRVFSVPSKAHHDLECFRCQLTNTFDVTQYTRDSRDYEPIPVFL
eukprot:g32854.t1